MVASDQYQLDINSVENLIRAWRESTEEVGRISQQLSNIHNRLESSIPSALVEGLLGEVSLAECFEKLAAAVAAANSVTQGLAQDTSTLAANLVAYVSVEEAVEAKLRSVHAAKGGTAGHGTHTSGASRGGSSSSGHGHEHGSGHGHAGHGGGSGVGGGGGSDSSGNDLQPPGPARYANRARVESWINQAFKALEAAGVPASELNEAGVLLIIEHESSGNPNAVNNWDGNAKAGDPSRGLMQVIGTTFNEYKLSGHDDIYNPVDNIIAGVRYAISRYGSIRNVPGVKSVDSGGKYVGY